MSLSIPYLPAGYEAQFRDGLWFHFSGTEAEAHKRRIQTLSIDAFQYVQNELATVFKRQLHVCCYGVMLDSERAFGRRFSPSLAMAPFSSQADGLIVIHSPRVDPRNGDPQRLRRLLVHELVHQAVAEGTASTKVLGDGNKHMHVATWLNEGLAELLGLDSIGASDRLAGMRERFGAAETFHSFDALSQCLDALDDPLRPEAFEHVTAAVQDLCHRMGVRSVFAQLKRISRSLRAEELCTPERMAEFARALGPSMNSSSGSGLESATP